MSYANKEFIQSARFKNWEQLRILFQDSFTIWNEEKECDVSRQSSWGGEGGGRHKR